MNYEDFELPACRVVFEALSRYYKDYNRAPVFESLNMIVSLIISNSDGRAETVVSVSDYDSIFQVLQALMQSDQLDTDYFRSKIGAYLKTVRVKKIIADTTTGSAAWQGDDIINKILQVNEMSVTNPEQGFSSMSGDPEPVMNEMELAKLKTGITTLDSYLRGGLGTCELGLIVGMTGLGKTNTLINFQYAATMVGWSTLFITLELEQREIKHRWNCIAGHIDGKWVHVPFPKWPKAEKERIQLIWSQSNRRHRYDTIYAVTHGPKVTMPQLDDIIGRWKDWQIKSGFKAENCRGVYVDWLDKMDKTGLTASKNTRDDIALNELTDGMGKLTRKHDVSIWTATQATAQASNVVFLEKRHTAQSFHKLDSVDVAVGIGMKEDKSNARHKDNEEMFDPSKAGQLKDIETRRVLGGTILKNRKNPEGTRFTFYQGPTLRYFDNEHDALSIDNMIKQDKIAEALGTV